MNTIKKSNKSFPIVVSFSLLISGITIITSTSTNALSLGGIVNELPIVGSGNNNNESQIQSEETPNEVSQTQQDSSMQIPVESPLTPILNPIMDVTQPIQQVIPPVQTPAPLPNPVPIITKPVTKPPSPVVTSPRPITPTKAMPVESVMNVHTEAEVTKMTTATPAPAIAAVLKPLAESSQPNQFASTQSNQSDFFAKYMSSKITPAERNQLYAFGAIIALVGIAIYLLSTRSYATWPILGKLRKPLTINN